MHRSDIMSEKKIDSRIRRTKKLLREGLTQLMKEKSVNKISVRELTDLVEINRGTFYLHYKDIFDLLEQIEDELCEEFQQMLDKITLRSLNDSLSLFLSICLFLENNKDLCNGLLSENGDISFLEKLKSIISEKCFRDFPKKYFDNIKPVDSPYISAYLESGTLGIIRHWLGDSSPMRKTPEDVAYLLQSLFANGLSSITAPSRK